MAVDSVPLGLVEEILISTILEHADAKIVMGTVENFGVLKFRKKIK